MEMESLGYVDAVKFLADRAGMDLPEYKADADYRKKKDRQETLKALMKDAARYYHLTSSGSRRAKRRGGISPGAA